MKFDQKFRGQYHSYIINSLPGVKHGEKEIPVVYFRYRFNPVNIKYFLEQKNFVNLIVQVKLKK